MTFTVASMLAGLFAVQQAPAPDLAVAPFDRARVVATLTGCGEHVAVAPDGKALAVVDVERGLALVVDAATGDVRALPRPAEVRAVALLPGGRGAWLGLADGALLHVPAEGPPRRFEVASRGIDGVVCVAGNVAWSSSGGDRCGVVDAETGASRWADAAPVGEYRSPRIELSRDGRHALHLDRHPDQGGRRLLRVRDARTGQRLAEAPAYLSRRGLGVAVGLDHVFSAARVAANRWQLRSLDLVSLGSEVLDADLRGGHFVELVIDPGGRWLAEGDREEQGAVLYDLTGARPRRTIAGNGAMPLGFVRAPDSTAVLLTPAGKPRLGLSAWAAESGELLAEDLAALRELRCVAAGGLRAGAFWVMSWSARQDRSIEYRVDVVALDPPPGAADAAHLR